MAHSVTGKVNDMQCTKNEWRNNEMQQCRQQATTRCEECGALVCQEHADYDQTDKNYFGRRCIDCSILTQLGRAVK